MDSYQQSDLYRYVADSLIDTWLQMARKLPLPSSCAGICVLYDGSFELENDMIDNYRVAYLNYNDKKYIYFKSLVVEKVKEKYGMTAALELMARPFLHEVGRLTCIDHTRLESGVTADDVGGTAAQTIPTAPQIVAQQSAPAPSIVLQRGGIPSMFGHMAGAYQTFATATQERYFQVGENISINPDTASGTIIFSFNYTQIENPWMKKWRSMHEVYGGTINIKCRIIGAATYVGTVYVGFYYGSKKDSEIKLNDLIQYEPAVLGVASQQEVEFTFSPKHSSRYYFDATNGPDTDIRLIAMLGTPLRNTYPTDGIEIYAQVFSRPGDWYCIRPSLPVDAPTEKPDVSALKGKKLGEIFNSLGVTTKGEQIQAVTNSPSIQIAEEGIAYDNTSFSCNDILDPNSGKIAYRVNHKLTASVTTRVDNIFDTRSGITKDEDSVFACYASAHSYGYIPEQALKLMQAFLAVPSGDDTYNKTQSDWNEMIKGIAGLTAFTWESDAVPIYEHVSNANNVGQYVNDQQNFSTVFIFPSEKGQGMLVTNFCGLYASQARGNKDQFIALYEGMLNDSYVFTYTSQAEVWTRRAERSRTSPLTNKYKNIVFASQNMTAQNSTLLRQPAYADNTLLTKTFATYLQGLSDRPFIDMVLFDTNTGLEVMNIRFIREKSKFLLVNDAIYGVSGDLSDLTVSSAAGNELATVIRSTKLEFRNLQTYNPVRLEGAALAGFGGGAVSGIGNGLSTWAQMQQQQNFFEQTLGQNKDLFEQGQANWLLNNKEQRQNMLDQIGANQNAAYMRQGQQFQNGIRQFGAAANTSQSMGNNTIYRGGYDLPSSQAPVTIKDSLWKGAQTGSNTIPKQQRPTESTLMTTTPGNVTTSWGEQVNGASAQQASPLTEDLRQPSLKENLHSAARDVSDAVTNIPAQMYKDNVSA